MDGERLAEKLAQLLDQRLVPYEGELVEEQHVAVADHEDVAVEGAGVDARGMLLGKERAGGFHLPQARQRLRCLERLAGRKT